MASQFTNVPQWIQVTNGQFVSQSGRKQQAFNDSFLDPQQQFVASPTHQSNIDTFGLTGSFLQQQPRYGQDVQMHESNFFPDQANFAFFDAQSANDPSLSAPAFAQPGNSNQFFPNGSHATAQEPELSFSRTGSKDSSIMSPLSPFENQLYSFDSSLGQLSFIPQSYSRTNITQDGGSTMTPYIRDGPYAFQYDNTNVPSAAIDTSSLYQQSELLYTAPHDYYSNSLKSGDQHQQQEPKPKRKRGRPPKSQQPQRPSVPKQEQTSTVELQSSITERTIGTGEQTLATVPHLSSNNVCLKSDCDDTSVVNCTHPSHVAANPDVAGSGEEICTCACENDECQGQDCKECEDCEDEYCDSSSPDCNGQCAAPCYEETCEAPPCPKPLPRDSEPCEKECPPEKQCKEEHAQQAPAAGQINFKSPFWDNPCVDPAQLTKNPLIGSPHSALPYLDTSRHSLQSQEDIIAEDLYSPEELESDVFAEPRMTLGDTPPPATAVAKELVCRWCPPNSGATECGRTFPDDQTLQTHIETIHIEGVQREYGEDGFLCRWVGCSRFRDRCFQARPKLKRHVQVHSGYRPYVCKQCGTSMKTKDAMEKHERTHSGVRPYRCSTCIKDFATSTELKTHNVVHSGLKPHRCSMCNESFADSSNLSKHKKTHYIGMYKCPDCSKKMKRWDQMRRHLQSSGHAKYLQDKTLEKDYKDRMHAEFKALPEQARRIVTKPRKPRQRKSSSSTSLKCEESTDGLESSTEMSF